MSVDSACSSALVCVHLAARALAARDCDLAIAGAANLILTPTVNVGFAKARMLSAGVRCRSFQTTADGYVRSEGGGAVVLKRLADAIRDGDPVRAALIGSAVNQDGRTPGITVPSAQAQIDVIRRAWTEAGVTPDDIDVIEAHGTGTPVGDSVEVRALAAVLEARIHHPPAVPRRFHEGEHRPYGGGGRALLVDQDGPGSGDRSSAIASR